MRTTRITRSLAMVAAALTAVSLGTAAGASAAPAAGQAPQAVLASVRGSSPPPARAAHPHLTANTPAACNRSTRPGIARCLATVRTPSDHTVTADTSGPPSTALGPPDIQSAYHLPAASAGSGHTVAIVDAFGDSSAESDLATFRSQYGLPPCTSANGCFKKVDQRGGTNYPADDSGWALETSLDLDAVSAACPNCHILLVEGDDSSIDNLGAAVNEAATLGATAVSNSYGTAAASGQGVEDPSEASFDHYYDHPGVAVTASTGDGGYSVNYPSASQYVTAVGGTTLTKDTSVARGWDESVWGSSSGGAGTGSGCSLFEPQPPWQAGITADCPMRATSDISADADPQSGLAVYDTNGQGGWLQVGGTSLSSPLIAATYALAGVPASETYPSSYLFAHYASDPSVFNDVTSGANGGCGNVLCTAGQRWDGPTGLGTPDDVTGLAAPAGIGSITGTVADADTGKPVAGAQVSTPGLTVTTGSDGSYTLSGLPAGSVKVTVSAFGYQDTSATVTVTANQAATQNFQLTGTPHQTVSGTVTAGNGTPWPLYAQVTWSDGHGHSGTTYTTPATGKYSLSLVDNVSYTLTVAPQYPGYEAPAAKAVNVQASDVTQDFAADVDQLACTAIGYQANNTGATQSFDQARVPPGWAVTNTDLGYTGYSSQPGWVLDNPGQRANNTGGAGNFAIVDSDFYGAHHYQNTYLTSPVINMRNDKSPVVQFASDLQPAVNSGATVQVSTDGGQTWDTVWKNSGFPGDPGPATKVVALPQAAGKSAVRVRFGYLGEWSQYWQLDNVFVGEHTCTQQPGALLVGRVADSGGNAVNGATVASVANPAEQAVTVATPGDTVIVGGLYDLFVKETGSQQFTASATGYASSTQPATVTAGQVTTRDFTLASAGSGQASGSQARRSGKPGARG